MCQPPEEGLRYDIEQLSKQVTQLRRTLWVIQRLLHEGAVGYRAELVLDIIRLTVPDLGERDSD